MTSPKVKFIATGEASYIDRVPQKYEEVRSMLQELYDDLRPHQKLALESCEWLVSPNRREGKSFAVATALICQALKNPGTTFEIRDPISIERTRFMLEMVETVLSRHPGISKFVTIRRSNRGFGVLMCNLLA